MKISQISILLSFPMNRIDLETVLVILHYSLLSMTSFKKPFLPAAMPSTRSQT